MMEVFKIDKRKYDTTIVPQLVVLREGTTNKLLNQTFTTTYGIYTEDIPRLVCGTRLVTGVRLLAVQVN